MAACIGIIVVTTVGANICTNEIIAEAARYNLDGSHPEYVSVALPFACYKTAIYNKDWDTIANLILESIHRAKAAGADFAIMPSNTPHYAFDQVEKNSPIPVLNLIDLTVKKCKENGYKRVGILGTKITMQGNLYTDKLHAVGITPVVPNDESCSLIDKLIIEDIVPVKPNFSLREEVRNKIQQLECDAVILGCTELPEVYSSENIGKIAIDTTRLLAHEALKYANEYVAPHVNS